MKNKHSRPGSEALFPLAALLLFSFIACFPPTLCAATLNNPGIIHLVPGFNQPGANPTAKSGAKALSTAGAETVVTPEISELAGGLENNPVSIYRFVKNNIEFECVWTSRRDALQTLLDLRGNAFDQASLLIALLNAAGYQCSYVHGTIKLSTAQAAAWLGLPEDAETIYNNLGYGGIPVSYSGGSFTLEHVWVRTLINGRTYDLDPSLKGYTVNDPLNLAVAMGYDGNAFAAKIHDGATLNANFIQNMNYHQTKEALKQYSANLVGYLRSNYPANFREEVIGGKIIDRIEITELPSSMPYRQSIITTFSTIPDSLKTLVQFIMPGNVTYNTALSEVYGKRVTVFYEGSIPSLRIDGGLVASGSSGPDGDIMQIIVNSPLWPSTPFVFKRFIHPMYGHAVVFNTYMPSTDTISRRARIMRENVLQGTDEKAESVRGEVLNILGLNYFQETDAYGDMLGRLTQVMPHLHFACAVVADVSIDVGLGVSNAYGESTNLNAYQFGAASMGSAIEHGVMEQTQQVTEAISTVKAISLANQDGRKIFTVTPANMNSVLSQLSYDDDFKAVLSSYLAGGFNITLPQDEITINEWTGKAYILWMNNGTASYRLSGPVFSTGGGGGTQSSDTNASADNTFSNAENQANRDSLDDTAAEIAEPVNSLTGNLIYSEGGLSFKEGRGPRLNISLTYTSGGSYVNGVLGYGWRHNHQMRATGPITNWTRPLMTGSPVDAAAIIVASITAGDLLSQSSGTGNNLAAVSLINQWLMDQLTDNCVQVAALRESYEFIKLPDGSYNPPPGMFAALTDDNGAYTLLTRSGTTYDYDQDGAIETITDSNGNSLDYSYSGGLLSSVTDASNRSLRFSYDSGNRISKVTDSAVRTFNVSYDGSGNLASFTDADGYQVTYQYDTAHRLTDVVDPLGNTRITNTYDTMGRVSTQTDALGNISAFLYGGDQSIFVNPLGDKKTFLFNHEKQMTGTIDALEGEVSYTYNARNQLTGKTDKNDNSADFSYDAAGNLIKEIYPGDRTYSYTYDSANRLTAITDPAGNITTFTSDANRNITAVTDAAGNTAAHTYNDYGQITSTTDQDGVAYKYEYSAEGYLTKITDGGGNIFTYTYDKAGNTLSATDGTGNPTTYQYNNRGYKTSETLPLGNTYTYTYDGNGNMIAKTMPDGGQTTYTFDKNNRIVKITDALGNSTTMNYDAANNLIAATDFRGAQTTLSHDAEGRIEEKTDPLDNTNTYTFDPKGNLLAATDPLDKTSEFKYNAFDLKTESSNPLGNTVQYDYNTLKFLEKVSYPDGAEREFAYGPAAELKSMHDELSNIWQYSHSAAGRLRTVTAPNGAKTELAYDAMGLWNVYTDQLGNEETVKRTADGKIASISKRNGSACSYTYDANGMMSSIEEASGPETTFQYTDTLRPESVTNELGTLSYSYDDLQRPISYTDVFGNRVGFAYDENANLTSLTYPDGKTLTYSYDEANQLTSVIDWAGRMVAYDYDAGSHLTSISYPNGVVTRITYDDAGDMATLSHTGPAGLIIAYAITRNSRGMITSVEVTGGSTPNLTDKTASFSYDLANRLSAIDSSACSSDDNGNLTGCEGTTYTYDDLDRLTGVSGGTADQTYRYDGNGTRVSVLDGTAERRFITDGRPLSFRILAETGADNEITKYYSYGIGLLAGVTTDGTIRYYHFDYAGNTVALTDANGQVTDSYLLDPYGEILAQDGSTANPFIFGGLLGMMTDDSGLVYMRRRFYNPALGRFISEDPLRVASRDYNLYAYAGDNPVNFSDPLGYEDVPYKEMSRAYRYIDNLPAEHPEVLKRLGLERIARTSKYIDQAVASQGLDSAVGQTIKQGMLETLEQTTAKATQKYALKQAALQVLTKIPPSILGGVEGGAALLANPITGLVLSTALTSWQIAELIKAVHDAENAISTSKQNLEAMANERLAQIKWLTKEMDRARQEGDVGRLNELQETLDILTEINRGNPRNPRPYVEDDQMKNKDYDDLSEISGVQG